MKKLAALALLTLIHGCATATWNKPGATASEFEKDKTACQYEATKAVPDYGYGSVIAIGFERANITKQCLMARGWKQERQ